MIVTVNTKIWERGFKIWCSFVMVIECKNNLIGCSFVVPYGCLYPGEHEEPQSLMSGSVFVS